MQYVYLIVFIQVELEKSLHCQWLIWVRKYSSYDPSACDIVKSSPTGNNKIKSIAIKVLLHPKIGVFNVKEKWIA